MNKPLDKTLTAAQVVERLQSGMTIGVGGWGPRRKPMTLIREILRSDLKDLTVVAYGGPEIGMLYAAGKVKKLIYGFVSLDVIPLEPWFRKARESGAVQVCELDEGMLQWGLKAAGMRLPFLPTRVGLATDVTTVNPAFKTIQSPYDDAEVLLAMPAIELDVALLHVDISDRLGNTQIYGPDPYFDAHFARAAQQCFVSCEQVVDCMADQHSATAKANYFERFLVTGVVSAPGGAHPTSCAPTYGWDLEHLKTYCASATDDSGFSAYADRYVRGDEAAYQQHVGGLSAIKSLPLPVF